MRHGVESQGLLEQLSIELQELARVSRASIRDDKADIQILRKLGELRDEALLREVHYNNAMLNFKILRDTASYLNQCGFPPGHQHYVDPRRCDLPRKFLTYSGRGTRDKCPGAEPFFGDFASQFRHVERSSELDCTIVRKFSTIGQCGQGVIHFLHHASTLPSAPR